MRERIVVGGVLAAVLWPVPAASAQQRTGEFGGGAVTTPPAPALGTGSMVIGLRSTDGTTVQITATIVGRCASGTFTTTAPVAADGSFSVTGAVRQARTTTRYELRGVMSPTPSGTAAARFERTTKARTQRCSAVDVVWEARGPGGGFGDPAAVVPGALLLGMTAQRDGAGVPGAIALRTSPDGRFVSRAIYGVRMSCSGAGVSTTFDLPRHDLPIGPGGQVGDVEAGTVETDASILKYVERFSATVGSAGATGVFSVQLSVRRRATGKRVTLCRSGDVPWSASV